MSPIARTPCGSGCACRIEAGPGITVTGSGTPTDPVVITSDLTSFAGSFVAQDSGTLDLDLVGSGTGDDPWILSGNVTMGMSQLSDVDDPAGPGVGEVPVFNGVAWEFAAPPTVPPGAVNVGAGLSGDGSAPTPLKVAVSDTTSTSTSGTAIYVDSAGKLRAVPAVVSSVDWADITSKPTTFPADWGSVTGKPTTFPPTIGTTSTTAAAGDHTHVLSGASLTGVLPVAKGGTGGGTVSAAQTALNVMDVSTINSGFAFRDAQISSLSTQVAQRAWEVNYGNSVVKWTQGPDSVAYNRTVSGSGFFAVWMDAGNQFGRNVSSRRFKEDIEPFQYDPADVLALEPVTYHRIGSEERYEFGLIAEDVYEHLPGIVTWFAEQEMEEVEETYEEVVLDPDGKPYTFTRTRTVSQPKTGVPNKPPVIDGLRYDLLAVAELSVLKDHETRITGLPTKHQYDLLLARLRKVEQALNIDATEEV